MTPAQLFGDRLPLAAAYAELLATDGLERGLLGPRESERIWDRHLTNCALLTEELPLDARVLDVGSGAGLPGLVLAIRRPDLRVVLLEPMQRRVDFLHDAVGRLGLESQVEIVRGRADDPRVRAGLGKLEWVVARAVAPLDRLVEWCLPLLAPGGRLLAMKGQRAHEELVAAQRALRKFGAARSEVRRLGAGTELDGDTDAITVVIVERGRQ